MSFSIRPTLQADHPGIRDMVRAAFSDGDRNGEEEVDILARTWALIDTRAQIDLVAVDEGQIVGHVLAAEGDLARTPVMGIAPLSVAPDHQRSGVGITLINEVMRLAKGEGRSMLLLLGNPSYYQRFGFEPASEYEIFYAPAGDSPAFQVLILECRRPSINGEFIYCFE